MFKRIGTALLTILLGAQLAQAQGLLSFQLPSNTVVGNPRALPGPGSAIPFSTFVGLLLAQPSAITTLNFNVASGTIWNVRLPHR